MVFLQEILSLILKPMFDYDNEILKNTLYLKRLKQVEGLDFEINIENDLGCVFDEVRHINDRDRGKVWEETIILLPPQIQMLMLRNNR